MRITDDLVKAVTEGLCDDKLAVIGTLRPDDQVEYVESLCARTRRVLENCLDGPSPPQDGYSVVCGREHVASPGPCVSVEPQISGVPIGKFGTHDALTTKLADVMTERDRLRIVEAAAACVVDTYRGVGCHEDGMRGAINDLDDALCAVAAASEPNERPL